MKTKPTAPHCHKLLNGFAQLVGERQNIYSLLLEHGRAFQPAPKLPNGVKKGVPKQCYANATQIILRQRSKLPRYRYCEGYALPKRLFPMPHAWLIDDQDRVVDVTWPEGEEYFGVVMQRSFLISEMARSKRYGIFETFRLNPMLFNAPDLCFENIVALK